jgi:hypothetical protein
LVARRARGGHGSCSTARRPIPAQYIVQCCLLAPGRLLEVHFCCCGTPQVKLIVYYSVVLVALEDHWETVGRLAPAGCSPTEDFCRQRKEVPSGRLMNSVMAALAPLRASRPFAGLTDRHTRDEPPVSSLRFQITPTASPTRSMPMVQMVEKSVVHGCPFFTDHGSKRPSFLEVPGRLALSSDQRTNPWPC